MTPNESGSQISTPNLDLTIRKMDDLVKEFSGDNDRRERFLLMYRTFKNELRRNLHEGRFLDSDWSEAICCRMGGMYFEALEAYDEDKSACPESWVICFDAALKRETNLLQDALMGMNAHINYDLTVCVYDVMKQNGDFEAIRSDSDSSPIVDRKLNSLLKKRYFDYLLINQIAWESIPIIQDVLTNRFSKILGILNKASFRFSRAIVEKLILEYRDRAWTHALLLLSSNNQQEHWNIREFMDDLAVSNTKLIRKFVSFNPINLIRPAIQPEVVEEESEKVLTPEVADLLKNKLLQRETAEYASRTFVEYGKAAVPFLEHMLSMKTDDPDLEKQVYHMLGDISTGDSAGLLGRKLVREKQQPYEFFKAALKHDEEDIRTHLEVGPLYNLLDEWALNYFKTLRTDRDLASYPTDSLLMRTLRDRRAIADSYLRIVVQLIQVIDGIPKDQTDPTRFDNYDHIISRDKGDKWASLLKKIFQGKEEDILDWAGLEVQLEAMPPEQRIESIMRSKDEWLKHCLYLDIQREEMPFDIQISTDKLEDNSMISTVEKVLYLKNVELFNEIPAEELASIAKVAHEHQFEAGEYLIHQGNPGKNLYIITDGNVNVVKDKSVVTELKEGDVLGEIALLTESDASADCIAAEKTNTLQINQEDFLDFLYEGYPEIALGLIKVLIQRLEDTTERLRVTPV